MVCGFFLIYTRAIWIRLRYMNLLSLKSLGKLYYEIKIINRKLI